MFHKFTTIGNVEIRPGFDFMNQSEFDVIALM